MDFTIIKYKDMTTEQINKRCDWLNENAGKIPQHKLQYSDYDVGTYKTEKLPWFWTAHFSDFCRSGTDIKFYIRDKNMALFFKLVDFS
jgi:hypothetical protein